MKRGDIIRCVSATGSHLTRDKHYFVERVSADGCTDYGVIVRDDKDKPSCLSDDRFKSCRFFAGFPAERQARQKPRVASLPLDIKG